MRFFSSITKSHILIGNQESVTTPFRANQWMDFGNNTHSITKFHKVYSKRRSVTAYSV